MVYKNSQSFLEYSFLLSTVILLFIIMAAYILRSNQGRFMTLQFNEQFNEPYEADRTYLTEDVLKEEVSFNIDTIGLNGPTTISISKESFSKGGYRKLPKVK